MRRVCGEYLNSQRISIMATRDELLERTPEELVELILALRSDIKDTKGVARACEVKLLAEQRKCKELEDTMKSGAMKLIKYKKLEEQMAGVEKTNEELSNKVDKIEELKGTMEASIGIQQKEIEQLKIRNKELIKENAAKEQAVGSLRELYETATEECANNKEQIHKSMQETIDTCKSRIAELNKDEIKKDEIIAKFTNKLSYLNKQLLGLRQLEAEQKTAIMNAHQRHESDEGKLKAIKDTYTEELNKSRGEVEELRKRLKSTQGNLDRALNQLMRPRSPVGKVKEGEKGSSDTPFLAIGNKKSDGRKSPLGGGPSLNPTELARKIKYRF